MTPLVLPWFKLEPIALWGFIKLQPFGLLAAFAVLVGARFAQQRAKQLDIHASVLTDFLTWTTLVGLISAYVLNGLMYFPEDFWAALKDPPQLLQRYWGLSSYGGFLGGLVTAVVFCRRRQLSLSALGDAWCYAIPFAWVFARMGCFVVHDHPGAVSNFFLAVDNYNGGGVPRHDLGLYEVLWALAVAPLFYHLARSPRAPGFFLTLIPVLYGPMRFALDFLRATPAEGGDIRYLGLTPAQYLSLALSIAGVVLLTRLQRPAATATGTGPSA